MNVRIVLILEEFIVLLRKSRDMNDIWPRISTSHLTNLRL